MRLVLELEELFEMSDIHYKLASAEDINDDMRDFPLLLNINKRLENLDKILKREN